MIKDSGLKKLQEEYLENSGYSLFFIILVRKYGEIDLIMKDKDTIVFVEVRSLTKEDNIHPSETITKNKVKKIKKTAEFFLHKNKLHEAFCRFDFISLQGTLENYIIEHIKDAF